MFKPKKGRYFQDYSLMISAMQKNKIIFIGSLCGLPLLLSAGCGIDKNREVQAPEMETAQPAVTTNSGSASPNLERTLREAGLVNIQEVNPAILVDLRYSTTDNFMGRDMYGDLDAAYMPAEVAEKLVNAEKLLQQRDSSLTLLVFDAVRPLHIQQFMWDSLDIPLSEKRNFLSDPSIHSLHNYGAAIDLTIATLEGKPLDMGTAYDFIGHPAYPTLEAQMLQEGKLTAQQVENRKLLRYVMFSSGFTGIDTEWWHFNACTREEAAQRYRLIE